jgi:hypothetical protein
MMDAVELRLYRQPEVPIKWMFRAFKKGVKLAGPFRNDEFAPFVTEDSAKDYKREAPSLLERGFMISANRIADEHNWLSFGPTVQYYDFGFSLLRLQTILWKARESLEYSWELSLHFLKPLITATAADLAAIGGTDSLSSLPFQKDLPRSRDLPKIFAPVTFIGRQRLTAQRRKQLAALPAFRIEEFADGIIVQATRDLLSEPANGFANAVRGLANRFPVRYVQVLPSRRYVKAD